MLNRIDRILIPPRYIFSGWLGCYKDTAGVEHDDAYAERRAETTDGEQS
jgi:hypothetical protein